MRILWLCKLPASMRVSGKAYRQQTSAVSSMGSSPGAVLAMRQPNQRSNKPGEKTVSMTMCHLHLITIMKRKTNEQSPDHDCTYPRRIGRRRSNRLWSPLLLNQEED